jgi:hypothetical protein
MPRKRLPEYIFTPGSANSGNIKVPNLIGPHDLLLIQNVTRGVTLYLFSDPSTGATVTYDVTDTTTFSNNVEGVSTITLARDTSTFSADDDIRVYVEQDIIETRPWDFGTDAIERMRVSNPQSLIDADFEYGIQNTKWQSVGLNTGVPSAYELPGTDLGATSVSSSGGSSFSTITVVTSGSHGLNPGSAVSVFGLLNDKAEGTFAVLTTPNTTTFTYESKGSIPLGSIVTTYTNIRPGGFFSGSALPITSFVSNGSTPSVITCQTAAPHGLLPGSPLLIYDSTGGSQGYEGNFFAESIPNGTTFSFTAKQQVSTPTSSVNISVYARNDSFFIHRPFDGGVLVGTFTPCYGLEAKRQSKRYFRYQSGKGILFSTGTLLASNLDISSVYSSASISGSTSSSLITVTTDIEHGLQVGTTINLANITSSGYNGSYVVNNIIDASTFTVSSSIVPVDTTASLGFQPRVFLKNWIGAVVRTGIYDDTNGLFWEYDGTTLYAVKRSSTFQSVGTVTATPNSYSVTGSGTRFTDQIRVGDTVVLRGMAYKVTSIQNNNLLSIIPAYRGVRQAVGIKMALVQDFKIPQNKFNYDTIDGRGESGFNINVGKMQMLAVQYSWYGAGFADFMIRGTNGNFITVHRFRNNNVNDEAYMRTGNLPARYEVSNYGPLSRLAVASGLTGSLLQLTDNSAFPSASISNPVTCVITSTNIGGIVSNELVSYTGKSGSLLTGVQRPTVYSPYISGQPRIFYGSNSVNHPASSSIQVFNTSITPTLTHWGSAVIMDGGFDEDRGYQFNFARTNVSVNSNATSTVLLFRLAPSVSNTIPGDLGDREVLNRSQLLLKRFEVTTSTKCEVYAVLNPTNIPSNTVYTNTSVTSIGGVSTSQPSFSQYNQSFSTAPVNGELLFRITSPASTQIKSEIDLTLVKGMNNSIIGGRYTFPDGPDVLAIVITNTQGSTCTADFLLQWAEAQA